MLGYRFNSTSNSSRKFEKRNESKFIIFLLTCIKLYILEI